MVGAEDVESMITPTSFCLVDGFPSSVENCTTVRWPYTTGLSAEHMISTNHRRMQTKKSQNHIVRSAAALFSRQDSTVHFA